MTFTQTWGRGESPSPVKLRAWASASYDRSRPIETSTH